LKFSKNASTPELPTYTPTKSPEVSIVFSTRSITKSNGISDANISRRRKRGESIEEFNKQQESQQPPTFVPFSLQFLLLPFLYFPHHKQQVIFRFT